MFKVCLQRLYTMPLLPVLINGNLSQTQVLKVEWVSRRKTVECIVTHQADDDARGSLSGEQFRLIHIHHPTRNRQGLSHHAFYRILCRGIFKRLGMCQKHAWRQLDFSTHTVLHPVCELWTHWLPTTWYRMHPYFDVSLIFTFTSFSRKRL